MKGNCLVAQGGGPTAVLNASLFGVIWEARRYREIVGIYGAQNGIPGVLEDRLFDLRRENPRSIAGLTSTPGAALGSSRHKVRGESDLARILDTLRKHDIRYFLPIGGNDSMDTAEKIERFANANGWELRVVGIPKTIDNDLCVTDHCPGYGSVVKYLSTMVMEAGRDTEALSLVDRCNVIEVMGRNAGWIAAGTALARRDERDAPHVILLPEVPFDKEKFKRRVEHHLHRLGWCVVVAAEGVKRPDGSYLVEQRDDLATDPFGHSQLGGAAMHLKLIIEREMNTKARFAVPSTIQRNGIHCASLTDSREACEVGRMAVTLAVRGASGVMVTLRRLRDSPYQCSTGTADLSSVANNEKLVPAEWISPDGFFVTDAFIRYARPLIRGEVKVPLQDGLPRFTRLERHFLER